jgi:hypothetical protein
MKKLEVEEVVRIGWRMNPIWGGVGDWTLASLSHVSISLATLQWIPSNGLMDINGP